MRTIDCTGISLPALVLTTVLALGCGGTNDAVEGSSGVVKGGAGLEGIVPVEAVCLGSCDPLCVEPDRYQIYDQVVEDTSAGNRLWQLPVGAQVSWDDAVEYCKNLTLDGLDGFRLPSPDELSGIRLDPGGLFGGQGSRHYCVPSLDQAAFPSTPADAFWTSRQMDDDTSWYVDFSDGRANRDARSEPHWVRCTRDGE